MYFMSDPQALHVTRNVIPGKLGVDLHLHRVHIPLVVSASSLRRSSGTLKMRDRKMRDWKMEETALYGTPCITYVCSVLQDATIEYV